MPLATIVRDKSGLRPDHVQTGSGYSSQEITHTLNAALQGKLRGASVVTREYAGELVYYLQFRDGQPQQVMRGIL